MATSICIIQKKEGSGCCCTAHTQEGKDSVPGPILDSNVPRCCSQCVADKHTATEAHNMGVTVTVTLTK